MLQMYSVDWPLVRQKTGLPVTGQARGRVCGDGDRRRVPQRVGLPAREDCLSMSAPVSAHPAVTCDRLGHEGIAGLISACAAGKLDALTGGSSNGRTADSGSADGGSNPPPPTTIRRRARSARIEPFSHVLSEARQTGCGSLWRCPVRTMVMTSTTAKAAASARIWSLYFFTRDSPAHAAVSAWRTSASS